MGILLEPNAQRIYVHSLRRCILIASEEGPGTSKTKMTTRKR